MRMAEFELDAEVVVRILYKKSKLFARSKEEIEVARGSWILDRGSWASSVARKRVDIFLPMAVESCGDDDLLATIFVQIDFDMPIRRTSNTEGGRPPLAPRRHVNEDDGVEANRPSTPKSSGSGSSLLGRAKLSRPRILADDEESKQSRNDLDMVARVPSFTSSLRPPSFVKDTGAGVAIRQSSPVTKQGIIEQQYWGPVAPPSFPVLCTPMVVKYLRLEDWVPCWPKRPVRRDEESDN
jgi:hypothetical protein